ncbi:glycosyltransferase family 4 protein [Aequorivita antarctica]|uniref:Glycosyltransferase family 4 protein n=1 Tax=Aequorivita antarctica TaxID=153266 RepID=A0A5C6YYI3_9FLAO|nr:glycosyltransferase family 4 protein [Aequorivita antarctica]TXD72493.1 glycosyltransferase family 4 protein [Aequorivita antarctica]SRX75627.1 D-inositol 3-phosphate glycosyltransferase [Aequorivita antarctica]
MKKISLLHPFSAEAIGLTEKDLFLSHSKPHEKALLKLQEEGYEVSIDYFTGSLLPFTKKIEDIKKRFWPISKPFKKKRHGWRKQYSLFHYWNSFFNAPDVTIINMSGHGSPYCFQLAKMLVKMQKSYIAMIGGIHVSDDLQAATYYQNAHHIIVHTEVQKKHLAKNEVFKNLNIQVMPLGINTTLFAPKEKDPKQIELLFVGRISRLKQIEFCLESLAYLIKHQNKKVNLTIVGPVSDDIYYSELKALAKQLKIEKNIKFAASMEQKQLVPFYQKASLLLLPSAHESFGMVMVEAMACGTPVAAIKGSGGPDEIIEDRLNGILTTKETYAERILEYVQTTEMQQRFQENARINVEKKWSLLQTEEKMKALIKQVLVNL